MAIRRKPVRPEEHYTIVSNAWARDERLSLKARGLLTLILSHRVGWNITIESLAKTNPEGKAAIRTAVNELEDNGYLRREHVRDDGGSFVGYDYALTDPPAFDFRTGAFDFPTTDNPTTDNPTSDNRTHKKTISKKTNEIEDQLLEVPAPTARGPSAPYTEDFLEWWSHYPLKKGKGSAFKAWKKIRGVPLEVLIAGADRYANDPNRRPEFTKYPQGWLSERRWEDEDSIPARATNHRQQDNNERMAAARRQATRGQKALAALQAGSRKEIG